MPLRRINDLDVLIKINCNEYYTPRPLRLMVNAVSLWLMHSTQVKPRGSAPKPRKTMRITAGAYAAKTRTIPSFPDRLPSKIDVLMFEHVLGIAQRRCSQGIGRYASRNAGAHRPRLRSSFKRFNLGS